MKWSGVVLLVLMCIIYTAHAIEYPQFKSGVSTTGITANFDAIYSQASRLAMVHDVVENDAKHIVWKYKDTGNWAIVKDDGVVVIATPSAFSFDIKGVLATDLTRAKDLIKSAGGKITDAPLIYYVDDPYLQRSIIYDFNSNFYLNLFVPECTLQKAVLAVSGSDYAKIRPWNNAILTSGQHYWIDGVEVSGCDATYCSVGWDSGIMPGRGISCSSKECDTSTYDDDEIKVYVIPVDITRNIAPGIHKISASGIDDRHTLAITAITSPSKDEMLLYSDDYKTMINETRSSPITELYALIEPPISVINATNMTSMTNNTA